MAVTEHAALAELVADPRVSKDWRNWTAMHDGEIADDWPMIGMVKVTNVVTADGAEHQRLRRLVTRAFTRGRVQDLRPRVRPVVAEVLDDLPRHAEPGIVDLHPHFAHQRQRRLVPGGEQQPQRVDALLGGQRLAPRSC